MAMDHIQVLLNGQKQKATRNPKYNDIMCFQYAVTDALNDKNFGKKPQERDPLQVNTIGKKEIFLQNKKTRKSCKQILK